MRDNLNNQGLNLMIVNFDGGGGGGGGAARNDFNCVAFGQGADGGEADHGLMGTEAGPAERLGLIIVGGEAQFNRSARPEVCGYVGDLFNRLVRRRVDPSRQVRKVTNHGGRGIAAGYIPRPDGIQPGVQKSGGLFLRQAANMAEQREKRGHNLFFVIFVDEEFQKFIGKRGVNTDFWSPPARVVGYSKRPDIFFFTALTGHVEIRAEVAVAIGGITDIFFITWIVSNFHVKPDFGHLLDQFIRQPVGGGVCIIAVKELLSGGHFRSSFYLLRRAIPAALINIMYIKVVHVSMLIFQKRGFECSPQCIPLRTY